MTVSVKGDSQTGKYHVVDDTFGPIDEVNAFLRALDARGLSPRTIRAYAFDLVTVYRWLEYSNRELKTLSHAALLDFVTFEKKRGAHPNSINRRIVACRLLFEFLYSKDIDSGIGTSLPSSHYKGPGRDHRLGLNQIKKKHSLKLHVKVPQKMVTPLSAEQVRQYLSNLRRYRDIAIVHLMLLCGLRSREVLMIQCHDVLLLQRTIRVVGKGNKERMVPLADIAASAIEQYLAYERPSLSAENALFVCLQGKRRGYAMTPDGLRSIFRSHRRRSAVTCANPHRFRHTFGADMARAGVSLPVLQKLMGHDDPETTLQYINLSLADLADAYRIAAAKIQKRYDPSSD